MADVEAIRIVGGARLAGEVRVPGAKNSALMLMAAALLAEGRTVLEDVPAILDVAIMSELLRRLGCSVTHDPGCGLLTIDVPAEPGHQADYDLVRRMRASINVLGPLLGRLGIADVALPGGDNIGSRGLDLHISGLERLGATVESEHGYLVARAPDGLVGTALWLDFPSVGATLNLMMAAVLARGTTVIDNAAREPEIVDVANLLHEMGAGIDGIGTSTLTIDGVERLQPVQHRVIPDRIVAGTWAVAGAITRGDVTVHNAEAAHLEIALDKLSQSGADVVMTDDGFRVRMEQRPVAVDVVTLPYPGFPTDLQPHFLALNSIASGAGMVTENLFEARFRFVQELARMGAEVRTDGHHALVRGKEQLSGAPVEASDIRAGAALVLAGLVAEGVTTVHEVHHVDRGYANFVEDLQRLGADVSRVQLDLEAGSL